MNYVEKNTNTSKEGNQRYLVYREFNPKLVFNLVKHPHYYSDMDTNFIEPRTSQFRRKCLPDLANEARHKPIIIILSSV